MLFGLDALYSILYLYLNLHRACETKYEAASGRLPISPITLRLWTSGQNLITDPKDGARLLSSCMGPSVISAAPARSFGAGNNQIRGPRPSIAKSKRPHIRARYYCPKTHGRGCRPSILPADRTPPPFFPLCDWRRTIK